MRLQVTMLDGQVSPLFQFDDKAIGFDLRTAVADYLNMQEIDYFGFMYLDERDKIWTWLRYDQKLTKQLKYAYIPTTATSELESSPNQPPVDMTTLLFQVKFFPPEPAQLVQDMTRYQMCLQIQNDIRSGKLPCSFITLALLGAYLVQSELGDYCSDDHGDGVEYLREFDVAPHSVMSDDLLAKIAELHRSTLVGLSPAEAELHYLENAKKLAMYGVHLHAAKDCDDLDIMVGICASGVLVYKERLRINRFAWAKVVKIAYKRDMFYVKLRPGEGNAPITISFQLGHHRAAKRLWRLAIEHHTFFRLSSADGSNDASVSSLAGPPTESLASILKPRFGSAFRYSGRTQRQSQNALLRQHRIRVANSATTVESSSTPSNQSTSSTLSPDGNVSATGDQIDGTAVTAERVIGSQIRDRQSGHMAKSGLNELKSAVPSSQETPSAVNGSALRRSSETNRLLKRFVVGPDRPHDEDVASPGDDKSGQVKAKIVSSQTISSKTRTVETTTYSMERPVMLPRHKALESRDRESYCADNLGQDDSDLIPCTQIQTQVEQKITIQSDDASPLDHEASLAQAIEEAAALHPDMTIERIEIHRTASPVQ